jgi:hypothetical protein
VGRMLKDKGFGIVGDGAGGVRRNRQPSSAAKQKP